LQMVSVSHPLPAAIPSSSSLLFDIKRRYPLLDLTTSLGVFWRRKLHLNVTLVVRFLGTPIARLSPSILSPRRSKLCHFSRTGSRLIFFYLPSFFIFQQCKWRWIRPLTRRPLLVFLSLAPHKPFRLFPFFSRISFL